MSCPPRSLLDQTPQSLPELLVRRRACSRQSRLNHRLAHARPREGSGFVREGAYNLSISPTKGPLSRKAEMEYHVRNPIFCRRQVMKSSPTLTVPQVASILGISIPHAQSLLRQGKIKGWKTAKGWCTTQEAVEEYKVMQEEREARKKRVSKDLEGENKGS